MDVIAEFLNRGLVLQQMAALKESAATEKEQRAKAGQPSPDEDLLLDELEKAEHREHHETSGQAGYDPESDRRENTPLLDDVAFVSHDPVVGLVQSALDEYYDQPEYREEVVEDEVRDDRRGDDFHITNRRLARPPALIRNDDRRLFDKFSILDAGWVRSKIAEGLRLAHGKHAFNENPAKHHEIRDGARLVVVGDWGSGLPRAADVAKQMRERIDEGLEQKRDVHVIHLGDVYYSGWEREYRKRFLPYWPVLASEAERVGSWTLNANHDMYSGGFGYFDVALRDPRFARWQSDGNKPSSFFSLETPGWKIFALDTGFTAGELVDPQVSWLRGELKANAGKKRTMLLSHHQLASSYEKASRTLVAQMEPLLAQYPVDAWIWGHEHRCMLFNAIAGVTFPRCVGDGGIPVYQYHRPEDPYPEPGIYEHRRHIKNGLERWAVMGFAVLDFEGSKINATYVDEAGNEHKRETLG
jgi:hypothetical protein